MSRIHFVRSLSVLAASLVAAACSSVGGGAVPTASGGATVDQVEIVTGVSDQGRDPAVVALDVAEIGLCSATLIAPDVILTARHCVSQVKDAPFAKRLAPPSTQVPEPFFVSAMPPAAWS